MATGNQGIWGLQETKALLSVWGAEDVQRQLDGIVRNRIIYEKIAAELAELGYERTWQQCKTKIRNMVQKYRKVKDQNGVSGSDRKTCPFYEEIDRILGNRAASSPPVLLESGGKSGAVSVTSLDQDVGDSSPPAIEETSENTGRDSPISSVPIATPKSVNASSDSTENAEGNSSSTSGGLSRRDAITARKKGQKRKHIWEDGLANSLASVFEKAEERAAEREERMRKLELEMEEKRCKAEERHEERMFSMFMTIMQQMNGSNLHMQEPRPPPFPLRPQFQTPVQRSPYSSPSPSSLQSSFAMYNPSSTETYPE